MSMTTMLMLRKVTTMTMMPSWSLWWRRWRWWWWWWWQVRPIQHVPTSAGFVSRPKHHQRDRRRRSDGPAYRGPERSHQDHLPSASKGSRCSEVGHHHLPVVATHTKIIPVLLLPFPYHGFRVISPVQFIVKNSAKIVVLAHSFNSLIMSEDLLKGVPWLSEINNDFVSFKHIQICSLGLVACVLVCRTLYTRTCNLCWVYGMLCTDLWLVFSLWNIMYCSVACVHCGLCSVYGT